MASLRDRCIVALSGDNAEELAYLIQICDELHRGNESEGYKGEDMPEDGIYEQMVHKLEDLRARDTVMMVRAEVRPVVPYKQAERLGEMWMGVDAISKSAELTPDLAGHVVMVTPKYDGCSCAVKFVANEDRTAFSIEKAMTRGRDVGAGNINNTDLTNEFRQLLAELPWVVNIHQYASLYKSMTIRGELVVIDKTKTGTTPPATYVSSKINSNLRKIYGDCIGFKMFELMEVVDYDEVVDQPDMDTAMMIFQSIDESLIYDLCQVNVTDDLVKYFNKWTAELPTPIDGVVYCDPGWKYPTLKDQIGVAYGKYAYKPIYSISTRVVDVVYSVKKDGKLTPKFALQPFTHEKHTYEFATTCITDLHNFIVNDDLRYQSTVEVNITGSIPKVVKVYANDVSVGERKIELPTTCPSCGGRLAFRETRTNATLTCRNGICPGAIIRKLEQFFKVISIKGIGPATIGKFYVPSAGGPDTMQARMKNLFAEIGKKVDLSQAIRQAKVGDLLIALDLYTKTSLDKNTTISPVKNSLVASQIRLVQEVIRTEDDQYAMTFLELIH